MDRDPLQLASELFALIEDLDPDRLYLHPDSVPPLLQHWADLKPPLVALRASDPDDEVRSAAGAAHEAGNALFDALARWEPEMKVSALEDLFRDLPNRQGAALKAADVLLRAVA